MLLLLLDEAAEAPAASATTITWAVEADFDRDGTYETDLTGYVERPGNGLKVERRINPDGTYAPSQLSLDLSNRDGAFSLENTSSPFYGQLRPGVPIRATATYDEADATIWTGYIQRFQSGYQAGSVSICRATCYDIAWYLNEAEPVNVVYSDSRDTDGAIDAIRDAAGLDTGDVALDDGVQALPSHYEVASNPWAAMQAVALSEMFGRLYVDALGAITFKARSAWLGSTPDYTWGDGTDVFPVGVDFDIDPLDYLTSVRVRSTRIFTGQADVVLFRFSGLYRNSDAMALTAGQVWERTFSAESAYAALTTPVAITDYLANESVNGSGTDRTSLLTVTLTDLGAGRFTLRLKNTHSGTVYVQFQLRGQPVSFYADRPEATVTLPVAGQKAGQNGDIDVPWAGGDSLRTLDLAMQECRVGRYPPARITLHFRARAGDSIADLLAVELGDLVRYTDTAQGDRSARLDDWFRVTGIALDIPPDAAGRTFAADVTRERSCQFRDLDHIAYDGFDRDNATGALGTSQSGGTWANATGMNINSLTARANSDSAQTPNLAVGGSGDMVAEVALSNLDADADAECGVLFRYSDQNNHIRVAVVKGSNLLRLRKVVAGSATTIAEVAWTPTDTAEIRVIAQGSRIRVWLNYSRVIDTTDSFNATATRAGLYALNASGTVRFDNCYMEAL